MAKTLRKEKNPRRHAFMALQAQFLLVLFQIFLIFISSKMHVAISLLDPKCRIGKQLQTAAGGGKFTQI